LLYHRSRMGVEMLFRNQSNDLVPFTSPSIDGTAGEAAQQRN
jgi:hypothetical protein